MFQRMVIEGIKIAFVGRKSMRSMLLRGLLKRLLTALEVRVLDGSVLGGDHASWYRFFCWTR